VTPTATALATLKSAATSTSTNEASSLYLFEQVPGQAQNFSQKLIFPAHLQSRFDGKHGPSWSHGTKFGGRFMRLLLLAMTFWQNAAFLLLWRIFNFNWLPRRRFLPFCLFLDGSVEAWSDDVATAVEDEDDDDAAAAAGESDEGASSASDKHMSTRSTSRANTAWGSI
jgi:hypothetical protein